MVSFTKGLAAGFWAALLRLLLVLHGASVFSSGSTSLTFSTFIISLNLSESVGTLPFHLNPWDRRDLEREEPLAYKPVFLVFYQAYPIMSAISIRKNNRMAGWSDKKEIF